MKANVARLFAALAAATLITACAVAPNLPRETLAELAPQGRVRAAINYGNPVLARKDPATGELRGVTVDLARELQRRAGVPVELVGYDTVARMLAALRAGEWDVGFLAVDPARASEVAFTAPYMEVEVSYLVPAESDLKAVADVDRAGVRISVQERNAADLFLSRELKRATVLRTPNLAAAFAALRAGDSQAFAANAQELANAAAATPGYRVVEGSFTTIPHAAAVPAGRVAAAEYLRRFIDAAKADGTVRRALDASGVRGVVVAR
jgi:polar amino acid transport system substrate-binding protein